MTKVARQIMINVIICSIIGCASSQSSDYCYSHDCTSSNHKYLNIEHLVPPIGLMGDEETIMLADGRQIVKRQLYEHPLVFEVDNLLTEEQRLMMLDRFDRDQFVECWIPKEYPKRNTRWQVADLNMDRKLTITEMQITLFNNFDVLLEAPHVRELYRQFKINTHIDGLVDGGELEDAVGDDSRHLARYLTEVALAYPKLKSRQCQQCVIYPERSNDAHVQMIINNLQELLQLPRAILNKTDIAMLRYSRGAHESVHHDSTTVPKSKKHVVPCCTRYTHDRHKCRKCRFATVFVPIAVADDGGDIVLPLADHKQDVVEYYLGRRHNLNYFGAHVKPKISFKLNRALIMYHHHPPPMQPIDPENEIWYGQLDTRAQYGITPIFAGELKLLKILINISEDSFK